MPSKIVRLEVEDFQSLRKVVLPLGKLTALTGDSNLGKSSGLRALYLFVTGGEGKGMARAGTRGWKITVVMQDASVSWDGETYRMTAGGQTRDVTREVAGKVTGLREIPLAKDVSLIPNVVPPLMIAPLVLDDPAAAAKKLSFIQGDLPEAMEAMREAKRRSKNLDKEKTDLERQRTDLRNRLEGLWDAPEGLRKAEDLKTDMDYAASTALRYQNAQRAVARLYTARARVDVVRDVAGKRQTAYQGLLELMRGASAAFDRLAKFERAAADMTRRWERLRSARAAVPQLKEALARAQTSLEVSIAPGAPCPFSREALPEGCYVVLARKEKPA